MYKLNIDFLHNSSNKNKAFKILMSVHLDKNDDVVQYNKAKKTISNTINSATKTLKEFFSESTYTNDNLKGCTETCDSFLSDNDNNSESKMLHDNSEINLYHWRLHSLLYSNIYKVGDIPPPTSIQVYGDFILCGTSNESILLFNENEFLVLHLKTSNKNHEKESIININISSDGKLVAGCTSDGRVLLWNLANIEEILSEKITELNEFHIITPKFKDQCLFVITGFDFINGNKSFLVTYECLSDNTSFESYIYTIHEMEEAKWFSKRKEVTIESKKIIFSNNPYDRYSTKKLSLFHDNKELVFVVVALKSEIRLISLSNREYTSVETESGLEKHDILRLHEWYKNEHNSEYILGSSNIKKLVLFHYSLKNEKMLYERKVFHEFTEEIIQVKFISNSVVLIFFKHGLFSLFDTESGEVISSNVVKNTYLKVPVCYAENFGMFFVTNKGILNCKILSWQNIVLQDLRTKGPVSSLKFLEKICLNKSNSALKTLVNLPSDNLYDNTEIRDTFLSLTSNVISNLKNKDIEIIESDVFSIIGKLDYFFSSESLPICCRLIDEESVQDNEVARQKLCLCISALIKENGKEGSHFPPEVVNFVLENISLLENDVTVLEKISRLDIRCFNIDFVLKFFRLRGNFEVCVRIWANVFEDLYTPIEDMMQILSGIETKSVIFGKIDKVEHDSICRTFFWFLEYILKSSDLTSVNDVDKQRANIFTLLLSATTTKLDTDRHVVITKTTDSNEPLYPYIQLLLTVDGLMLLKLFDRFMNSNIKSSLDTLSVFIFLLENNINEQEYSAETIQMLGIFISVHIDHETFKHTSRHTFKLLYQALTIEGKFFTQSEAALLKLFETFSFNELSKENVSTLKSPNFYRCVLCYEIYKENWLECIRISLNLKLAAIFDFVELFFENKNVDFNDKDNKSITVNNIECHEDLQEVSCYEVEKMIYDNFERLYEIDSMKAVELIYFYDYDVSTIFDKIELQKTKIDIIQIIIDDSRFQIPNFLCRFYIKGIFEVYGKNENTIKKVENLIENKLLNSANFSDIIEELKYQKLLKIVVKAYRLANKPEEALSELLFQLEEMTKKDTITSLSELKELTFEAFTICKSGQKKKLWCDFIRFILKFYEQSEYDDIKELTMGNLSKICFALTTEQYGSLNFSIVDVFVGVLETNGILLSKSNDIADSLMHVSKTLNIEMVYYKALLKLFNSESKDLANEYNMSKLKGILINYKECVACNKLDSEFSSDKARLFMCGHLIHDACNSAKFNGALCPVCEDRV